MKSTISRLMAVFAGAVVGAVVFFFLMVTRPEPSKEIPPDSRPLVRIEKLQPRNHTAVITGFGFVRPSIVLDIIAEVDGRIIVKNPDVETGRMLEKGDLLFRIDETKVKAEMDKLEAQLSTVDAQIAEIKEQHKTNKALVEIEKKTHELTKKEYERQLELRDKGVASESDIDLALTRLNERTLALRQRESAIALHDTAVKRLQASHRAGEAAINIQKILLEKTVIRAPFACRIEAVGVNQYQYVRTGSVLARIQSLEAPVEIPVSLERRNLTALFDFENLERNMPPWTQVQLKATVSWDGPVGHHQLEGVVSRTSPTVDPNSRTVDLIVRLPSYRNLREQETPRGLLPGTFVKVDITGRQFSDVLVIPRKALISEREIYIIEEGRLHLVNFQPLAYLRDYVLVEPNELLPTGSSLVLTRLDSPFEGLPVREFSDLVSGSSERKAPK
jgi:multidrug efflux pump subunit AcrA (membrane-fusion protein)